MQLSLDSNFEIEANELYYFFYNSEKNVFVLRHNYSDPFLTNIKINGISIPGFVDTTYTYTLDDTTASSINIEPIPRDSFSSLTFDENPSLIGGINLIDVVVGAIAKNERLYEFSPKFFKKHFEVQDLGSPAAEKTYTIEILRIIEVDSVNIVEETASGNEGDLIQLNALVTPVDATDPSLTWTSSDDTTASVNPETGEVSCNIAGVAIITATSNYDPNKFDTCEITVLKPVTRIDLSPNTLNIDFFSPVDYTLLAIITPEDASIQDVIWSSSDEQVVTVDQSGHITVINVGSAIITATSVSNPGISGECIVTVS